MTGKASVDTEGRWGHICVAMRRLGEGDGLLDQICYVQALGALRSDLKKYCSRHKTDWKGYRELACFYDNL